MEFLECVVMALSIYHPARSRCIAAPSRGIGPPRCYATCDSMVYRNSLKGRSPTSCVPRACMQLSPYFPACKKNAHASATPSNEVVDWKTSTWGCRRKKGGPEGYIVAAQLRKLVYSHFYPVRLTAAGFLFIERLVVVPRKRDPCTTLTRWYVHFARTGSTETVPLLSIVERSPRVFAI